MDDLISRQEAIDALDLPIFNIKGKENAERVVEYLKAVLKRIKELPSAEPISQIKWERDTAISQLKELGYGLGEKPRKGKWILHKGYKGATWRFRECPFCGGKGWIMDLNYCPDCGADMRGGEDE